MKNLLWAMLWTAIILFVIYWLVSIAIEQERCNANGGVYVREPAGYTCIPKG